MTAGPIGCGVPQHPDECLCDVVLVNPLPPLDMCIRNYTRDVDMAAQVASMRDYCAPWTDNTILDFMLDVQRFWDEWHMREKLEPSPYGFGCAFLSEMPPVRYDSSFPITRFWEEVRASVLYCMDNFDDSLVTILDHIRVSPEDFYSSVVNGATTWDGLDVQTLDTLDKDLMEQKVVIRRVAAKHGLTAEQVDGLRPYWEKRRKRLVGEALNMPRQYFQELCADLSLTNSQIRAMVKERYGVNYSTSAISVQRKRMRDKEVTA